MTKQPARGRPRDPAVDALILKAASECLSRDGYERMTVDDVAREAGVTRPTVYRRWPTKEELAFAAVEFLIIPSRHEPTGDLRADLLDIARSMYDGFITHGFLGLLGSALTERTHHPEIYALYKERLIQPRRASIRAVLERGVADGDIPLDVDLDVVVAIFVGSFYAVSIAGEARMATSWPERLVDAVMRSIRSAPPHSSPPSAPAPCASGTHQ